MVLQTRAASPHYIPGQEYRIWGWKENGSLKLDSWSYLKRLYTIRGLLFQETERKGQKIPVAKETCRSWHSYINLHFYWGGIFSPNFIWIAGLQKKGILSIYFIFSCKQPTLKELKDLNVDLPLPTSPPQWIKQQRGIPSIGLLRLYQRKKGFCKQKIRLGEAT